MSPVSRTGFSLLACWLTLTAVGCATFDLTHIDLRSRKATARRPAIRIVCLWEPAEGRDPKGVPCKGFAGQILFLTSSSLPVSVEGDVRVYLFDDQGTAEDQAKPLHQFDFDTGAWSQHYSYGTLGPAYNVFIPYMRRGVNDATCALRVRLTPKTGPAIFSDMTSIKLLGFENRKPASAIVPITDPRVEQTTPEDLTAVNKRRKTTTIALNGKPGEPVSSTTVDGAPQNPVQLATFEEIDNSDMKPLTSDDVRISQLEKMVKELRALQGQPKVDDSKVPSAPPRTLEEIGITPGRIRMRSADGEPGEQGAAPVQATETRVRDDAASSSTGESIRRQLRAAAGDRQHPLDDESEPVVNVRSNQSVAHPLNDAFDEPVRPARPSATAANRAPQKRHPLDEIADEEPPRRAIQKTVRMADPEPQGEADRSQPFDPFDPIDTEAIETTSVDENRAIRRQLKAAAR